MKNKEKRIKELIDILNAASKAYYDDNKEIMSNFEYDALYDELVNLENETGIVLSNSPTQNVGYEAASSLPKEKHNSPMLSLDKTKDRDALKSWLSDKEGVLSYKLDGLTVVLTYESGSLSKAVTRGNGQIGEVITNNAKCFENIPLKINYDGRLIIRGEAIIKYSDFEKINSEISDENAKYKNARNLCSGSVRQLDPKITKKRHVNFFAFALVESEGKNFKTITETFDFLENLGFSVVIHKKVNAKNILDTINWYEEDIKSEDCPSDGLVLIYDDIKYGNSLGMTNKFPRNAIAFKWKDETAVAKLINVEWSASRTGLINPVAIFEPVSLEGTTVSRASIHNVSIFEDFKLGVGDEIVVYKANMIIPQVLENLTKSAKLTPPKKCPVCGKPTEIKNENGIKTLHCTNDTCPAKQIKSFELFVSRDAFNIEGISSATMEHFVDIGFIKEYADIFKLENHKDEIISLDGFGEKSYENMINAIKKASKINFSNFIYALGINGIGSANSKLISKHFKSNLDKLIKADEEELCSINEIGPVLAKSIHDYFNNENNIKVLNNLLKEIELVNDSENTSNKLDGKTFVITGSLNNFANRKDLQKLIEDAGGKVASSVSNKTDYLINNDINSNSSKNKTAKELNVKIITENDILSML